MTEEFRKKSQEAQTPDELQQLNKELLDYLDTLESKYKKAERMFGYLETGSMDADWVIRKISFFLKKLAVSDPDKPISRKLRNKIHLLRGEILELHVNNRCGCDACGGERAQDRYEKAKKISSS